MKPALTIFLFLLIPFNPFGQSDTLNQVDEAGLKQGWWIVYLDQDWEKIENPAEAVFTRYALFKNDGNFYPMAKWGKKNSVLKRNDSIVDFTQANGGLLDGEYKWYDKKGRLLSTHILKNGIYQKYEYYYKNGNLKGGFLYNEQCGATRLDYCMFLCDKDGNITHKGTMPRDETGKPINKE